MPPGRTQNVARRAAGSSPTTTVLDQSIDVVEIVETRAPLTTVVNCFETRPAPLLSDMESEKDLARCLLTPDTGPNELPNSDASLLYDDPDRRRERFDRLLQIRLGRRKKLMFP